MGQSNLDNSLGCKCCIVSFIVQIVVAHQCAIVPIGWCFKKIIIIPIVRDKWEAYNIEIRRNTHI